MIDRSDYVLRKTSRARDDFAMIASRAVHRPTRKSPRYCTNGIRKREYRVTRNRALTTPRASAGRTAARDCLLEKPEAARRSW